MESQYCDDEHESESSSWVTVFLVVLVSLVLLFWAFALLFLNPSAGSEGVVIDKQFTAAHDVDITSEYTSETDKYEIYRHYPDTWQITVSDGYNWLGMRRTSTIYVLRDRYKSLEIGYRWKWTGGLDYENPPEYWQDPIPDDIYSGGYHNNTAIFSSPVH